MSIDTRAQRAADAVHASARGVDPMTQIVDLKREVKNRQRTGLVVTAAVVLVVVGGLALSTRWFGSDEAAPPAGTSVTYDARQVAAGFLQAYGSYDADRAVSYLTDDAITTDWPSPEGLRADLSWNEAVGWTELRSPCQRTGVDGATVELRCDYQVHALGSDQLGRGPYGDSFWTLRVRDGKIVYASPQFPFEANGFSGEMWEPFLAFVDASHPGDADVMYNDNRTEPAITPESLQLWEQHIADYVAAEAAG
jgi:hypothetical protein